jgi:hypothetical protein
MSTVLELPTQYWPTLLVVLGSVLGVLKWFGMLSRPADSGDLKVFQSKLELLESFHQENREMRETVRDKNEREHQEIRNDIGKVASSLSRIEGRMEIR